MSIMSKKKVGKFFIGFMLLMIALKTVFTSTPISVGTLTVLVLWIIIELKNKPVNAEKKNK